LFILKDYHFMPRRAIYKKRGTFEIHSLKFSKGYLVREFEADMLSVNHYLDAMPF
jgi:hypothetical protein